jgi:hypothetical protein
MTETPTTGSTGGTNRRDLIKKLSAGTAIAWTAPVVLESFASRAMAFTCTGPCYRVEIDGECGLGDTSGGFDGKVACDPACPPDSSEVTGLSVGGMGGGGSPATFGFTLVYAEKRTYDFGGSFTTEVQDVSVCAEPNAGVPNAEFDEPNTHAGIDRYRIWEFDQATFAAAVGESCTNPKIENVAAAQLIKNNVLPPNATGAADWVEVTDDAFTCCGTGLSAVPPPPTAAGCSNLTVANVPSGPYVYTDGRSSTSVATVSTSPYRQRATFNFDGRFQAKKSMSGFYRFTIGCDCDA